jgi:hypothetical protein
MRSYCTIVYMGVGFRELTLAQQAWEFFVIFGESQKEIDIRYFAEMWANWIQEQKLIINVSFD